MLACLRAQRRSLPPVTQRLATTQHLSIVCGAYLLRVDNLPLIARGEQHEGVEVEGPTPSTKASMDLVLLLRVSHDQVVTCWPACAPKDGVCREEEGEQTTCSDGGSSVVIRICSPHRRSEEGLETMRSQGSVFHAPLHLLSVSAAPCYCVLCRFDSDGCLTANIDA
ncbi:unnamed protein product [Prorocentrum cordatum]|uniref:Anaphase-promoting complex subunit 1 n=1 Tax=Prorocentrum cordatum TaxID=2364126 RepID=A0ABN9S4Z2_9DINO|nr:unnamed protein product [Polarella glacialis]